jgi:23S rRNA (cytosine1962-C5)-methyltransferase
MPYPTARLKKGKEVTFFRKHPWIFSGAIQEVDTSIEEGDLVAIQDYQGKSLGVGFYSLGKTIALRVIGFEPQLRIDMDFWVNCIKKAYEYRVQVIPGLNSTTNAYRLFNGEGDGVSGLIVDVYNQNYIIQAHNYGVYKCLGEIGKALIHFFGEPVKTIYCKSKETLPSLAGQFVDDRFIFGNLEEDWILENNLSFKVNWVKGQKTGFFLDQRENRALLAQYSPGKRILNCFSYSGGFSIYGLCHNALEVVSVDVSEKAIRLCEENVIENKVQQRHQGVVANVLEYLKSNEDTFDIVVVDPPAFAKSLAKRHNAVQAYKRLNVLALKKVGKGGLLFTFSCSQVIGEDLFYNTITAAAIESGRNIRVVKKMNQGPDHPINIYHPEGHYLKGLVLCVE